MIGLKRFLKNKNTVTIIGIILVVVILFVGYVIQINRATDPIKNIPVAAQTIQPRTKITDDMIEYIDVASVAVRGNVIRNSSEIIGKYSNINTVIPEGSMFYDETVVSEEELPDATFAGLKKGEKMYMFPVTMESTYANSITPSSYIDIYMKALNSDGKIMVGKLITNIKVLGVKDSSGNSVFENSEENRTPAYLMFGLNDELWFLLKKASYLTESSIELFPVPRGQTVTAGEDEKVVSSQTLRGFINSQSVANDDLQMIEDEAQAAEEEAENAQNQNNGNQG